METPRHAADTMAYVCGGGVPAGGGHRASAGKAGATAGRAAGPSRQSWLFFFFFSSAFFFCSACARASLTALLGADAWWDARRPPAVPAAGTALLPSTVLVPPMAATVRSALRGTGGAARAGAAGASRTAGSGSGGGNAVGVVHRVVLVGRGGAGTRRRLSAPPGRVSVGRSTSGGGAPCQEGGFTRPPASPSTVSSFLSWAHRSQFPSQ